jgi:hypothetical protein
MSDEKRSRDNTLWIFFLIKILNCEKKVLVTIIPINLAIFYNPSHINFLIFVFIFKYKLLNLKLKIMKKIFTLFILCALFLGTTNAQKKVLYLGVHKTTMLDSCGVDTVLLWMKSIPTVLTVDTTVDISSGNANYATQIAANSTNGVNDYDMVIMNDQLDGKRCSTLTAAVITKPCLMNKLFAMTSGRLNMGTPANITSGALYISVPAGAETSNVFTGITIPADRRIKIFNKYTTDFGSVTGGTNGIQVINDTTFAVAPTTGMEVLGRDTLGSLTGISIFRLDANTNMGYMAKKTSTPAAGQTYTAPMICLGFNAGAIWRRGNLTVDGLRIYQNSIYILAGLDPANVNQDVLASQAKASKLAITCNGNTFQINFGKVVKSYVTVYSTTGQLVSKKAINADNASIDLSAAAKGIYILQVNGLTQKVLVK